MAKVLAVRPAGRADVYNMEVEGHHNFSVAGGLVVHNCYDSVGYGLLSYHVGQSVAPREEQPVIRRHKNNIATKTNRRRRR